jgi:hypothetical protein
MTTERNVTSRSRNASDRTKPNTYGAVRAIRALKSSDSAVRPVTSAPLPTVPGTSRSRRRSSAAVLAAFVPSPGSGTATAATVRSSETSTVAGPRSRVARCRSAMRSFIGDAVTSSPRTTTVAGIWSPGNAAWMRS